MAKVISLAITVFMAAPILAPGFGQMVLLVAPWRGIFIVLLLYGLGLMLWMNWRLPETLSPKDQKPLRAGPIASSYLEFVSNRTAIGYTMASALCFGALFSYISTSEQIFLETFNLGQRFPIAFAAIAASLGAATLINTQLVSRFGMRRISHGAILAFIFFNIIHLTIATALGETFFLFMLFMSISFFTLGLIGPNANAIAMEPMGHIAGAAAAANGFAGTTIAGLLGGMIGWLYDGTTMPIIFGFTFLGMAALGVILWTEKGRLFESHQPDDAQ